MMNLKILQHHLCLTKVQGYPRVGTAIVWLQYIHHINLCKKPAFPINLSLIFTLIVHTNLSLVQQTFVDSVNFIVHICNIKVNKYISIHYWKKQSSDISCQLHSKKIWKFSERGFESSSAHWFKSIQREFRRFLISNSQSADVL